MLVRRSASGDLSVKQHATWGMSVDVISQATWGMPVEVATMSGNAGLNCGCDSSVCMVEIFLLLRLRRSGIQKFVHSAAPSLIA